MKHISDGRRGTVAQDFIFNDLNLFERDIESIYTQYIIEWMNKRA